MTLVHNLKTPLTGILATLEMLGDGDFGPLNGTQQEAILAIRQHTDAMLGLVGEILDVQRLEASGDVPLTLAAVDLAAMMQHIDREWRDRFRGRLSVEVPPGTSVTTHSEVLQRVLGNLLHNALTHGGQGVSVTIIVQVTDDIVNIDIRDDGPGIPESEHERVFGKFVRLDDSGSRGTGLGLSYCRAAMAALEGDIRIIATNGSGVTFRVSLPRQAGES